MSNSKRDKISNLDADNIKELEDSKIIVYGICIAILIAGVFIGYMLNNFSGSSLSSVLQTVTSVLIGLVVTGVSPYFMKRFIEKYTSDIEKRHEKDKAEIEENHKDKIAEIKKKHSTERNNWSRGLNNPYRVSQDLEFLSMMFKDRRGDPSPISSFSAFCKEIVDLNNDQRLVEKLEEYIERVNDREVALSGLKKGFEKEDKDTYPFSKLIIDACNFAFDRVDEKGKPYTSRQIWMLEFYEDIRTYIRAWLSCSIKYGVRIPIKPIFNRYLQADGERIYCGKDKYIKAIKYFQEKTLNNKAIGNYFTTPGSRKIIIEYLDYLIAILDLEIESEVELNNSNYS